MATRNQKKTTEVVYLVTSAGLPAAPPARIAAWVRGHWGVENRLLWFRDVTFEQDRHQVRTGSAPQVRATIRNLSIGIHRMRGATNIARATRHAAWDPLGTCDLVLTLKSQRDRRKGERLFRDPDPVPGRGDRIRRGHRLTAGCGSLFLRRG